jgi:hypothetical protein
VGGDRGKTPCGAALKDAQSCLTVEELETILTELREKVTSRLIYISAQEIN